MTEASPIVIVFLMLQAISAICFFLAVFTIKGFKGSLDKMGDSVTSLNNNVVTLIEKDNNKDERLTEHKDSIAKCDKEILKLRDRYHDMKNELGGRVQLLELTVEELKHTIKEN